MGMQMGTPSLVIILKYQVQKPGVVGGLEIVVLQLLEWGLIVIVGGLKSVIAEVERVFGVIAGTIP
jgi:hypothetical protein